VANGGEGSSQSNPNGKPGSPPNGDGSDQGDGDDAEGNDKSNKPAPKMGHGGCGSAADGQKKDWEDGPPSDENPGLDRCDMENLRHHVAKEIREAAKSRGDVPGHWVAWAVKLLEPQVDWRRECSGAIRAATADVQGAIDYLYGRPARRQGSFPDYIIPSLRQPIPQIAAVVDTSGSMRDDELGGALTEVKGIIKSCGFRTGIPVIACDTRVTALKTFSGTKGLDKMGKGRGGTDMRVGMARAMELRPRPNILVVITDGGTPWPDVKPRGIKRVIVCLVGRNPYSGSIPSWCRVIRVPWKEQAA
jgi:predicted metal-dependent peptidase